MLYFYMNTVRRSTIPEYCPDIGSLHEKLNGALAGMDALRDGAESEESPE